MMSTLTSTNPRLPPGHYHATGVLRSEFTKLRTLRSTLWSIAALAATTIAVGVLVTRSDASSWAHMSPSDRADFDPTNQSLAGLAIGQLALGVLGILAITTEFSTGSIRSTLSAVPNRPLLLAAKASVFGAVALLVGETVAFLAFLSGQAILSGTAPHTSLFQPAVLRAVLLAGVYVAGSGLIALGLGAIIRHTAAAITAFVALNLALPLALNAFPKTIQDTIGHYLPDRIGSSLAAAAPGAAWSPWTALGLLCLYVAIALGVGGWQLRHRDP
jgi:ABC-2 type transport system permease protein